MVDGDEEYANQVNVTALFLKILLSGPYGPTKKFSPQYMFNSIACLIGIRENKKIHSISLASFEKVLMHSSSITIVTLQTLYSRYF
jgi:hypothetical protein